MLEYKTSTGDYIFINPRSIAAVKVSEDIPTWSYVHTSGGCWLVQRERKDVIGDIDEYFKSEAKY